MTIENVDVGDILIIRQNEGSDEDHYEVTRVRDSSYVDVTAKSGGSPHTSIRLSQFNGIIRKHVNNWKSVIQNETEIRG